MLPVSLSNSIIEEVDSNSAETALKDVNLNRRKLPIFPKNTIKFVVTPTLPTNIGYIHKPKEKIMPKMKLMPHFTLKPEVETTTTLLKRKPLMKLRTFTVKSRVNGKFDGVVKDPQTNAHTMNKTKSQIGMNGIPNPVIEQDITTEVYIQKESQINFKKVRFNKMRVNDKAQQNKVSDQIKDKFLFGEELDRNEFIFLENEKQEQMVNMQDDIGQDFDGGLETTTEFKMTEKIERIKR